MTIINATPYQYSKFLPTSETIGGTTITHEDHVHLSFGYPNSSLFPLEELAEAARQATLEGGSQALHYSGGTGVQKIQRWLQHHLLKRNIEVTREKLLITAGAGQAIDIVSHTLLNEGDEVWIEAPSFFSAIRSFELVGAKIRSFAIDSEGLQVDRLEIALQQAVAHNQPLPKLVYIMPNYHNPSGVVLSLARRKKLAALALEYNFYILEDDAYGDLNFTGETLPSVYAFTPERVIYVGTFSKIIGPGIRLGWLVGNELLVKHARHFMLGTQTNPYTQEIIATLLEKLTFDDYLNHLIETYKRQRDTMVHALNTHFASTITFDVPQGGFFVFIEFKKEIDVATLVEIASTKGVSVVEGTAFYVNDEGENKLRLCFTYCDEAQIEKGIKRLAESYDELVEEEI